MGYKALLQIILIILAIALIFVYIKPTFADIANLQEEVYQYQDAIAKATEFNSTLQELLRKESSYSDKDRLALDTFLPNTVDGTQVMRDLEALFSDYDIELSSLSIDTEQKSTNVDIYLEGEPQPASELPYQDFSVAVVDSYGNIKQLLSLIESNAYPLEIISMTLSQAETADDSEIAVAQVEDEFSCELVLRVQSLQPNVSVKAGSDL